MPPWLCRLSFLNSSHYLHKFPIFAHRSRVSFSTLTPKILIVDYLVNHHHFSPECAANVSSSSSFKYINKPQNADSILNFLKETGFLKSQVESVVQKLPKLLSADLEKTVKPKIKVFQDLGFDSTDFADIISTCPWLLNSSADRIRLSILGLKNVLGDNGDIRRVLKKSGSARVLMNDWERTFVPNMEYLKSCGICFLQIAPYVCRDPWVFRTKLEKFKSLVERVDEMGVDRKSKMFIYAVRAMGSMTKENCELKLKLFRDLGISEQNILHAFRVCPQAFSVSVRKLKEVTELLFSVEGFVISDIACNPVLLTLSVEKRFKPRLRVLKALESKDLLKERLCLTLFFRMSHAKFKSKYVIPYSDELGDVYLASHGS